MEFLLFLLLLAFYTLAFFLVTLRSGFHTGGEAGLEEGPPERSADSPDRPVRRSAAAKAWRDAGDRRASEGGPAGIECRRCGADNSEEFTYCRRCATELPSRHGGGRHRRSAQG